MRRYVLKFLITHRIKYLCVERQKLEQLEHVNQEKIRECKTKEANMCALLSKLNNAQATSLEVQIKYRSMLE